MDGINSDKVQIHVGGGGDGGAASTAAVIAALGNRNQADLSPAILASLGNRNQGDNIPALIAALSGHDRHRGYDDGGFGFGGGGGILGLLAILGLLRGRGGLGGGDCDDNGAVERPVFNAAVLSKLGSIEGAIPTAALETQNQICESVSSLALGTQQGFANVKDSVQGLALYLANQLNAINTNVSDQGCRTRDTVQTTSTAILSRIDGNRIAELEAQIARMHSHDHARDSEIRITQTVNQNQQQAQAQAQLQGLFGSLQNLANDLQLVKQGQTIFNSGTMAASGTQAAANTRVN